MYKESVDERSARVLSIQGDVSEVQSALDEISKRFPELDPEAVLITEAIREACTAALDGNYGIGAVIALGDKVVAAGHNRLLEWDNPYRHVSHAEVDALAVWNKMVIDEQLTGDAADPTKVTVASTLEPCQMCTVSILNQGVNKVITGATDPYAGQMISHPQAMPPLWLEIHRGMNTVHRVANIPDDLADLSNRIFTITKLSIDTLLSRS
jgi:tRNA(adenine34) deaminase